MTAQQLGKIRRVLKNLSGDVRQRYIFTRGVRSE